jgi:hypothetical protein
MAIDKITASGLGDGEVSTDDLANDSVTTAKIATGAVDTTELASGAVTSAKLDTNITITGDLTVDNYTLHVDSANNRVGIGTGLPTTALTLGTSQTATVQNGGSTSAPSYAITSGALGVNGTYVPAANTLGFVVGGAERGRFTANGLTFNGDTAATNALDDYEEGTFTPIFTAGSSNPTVSYDQQVGHYQKIGNTVYFMIQLGTGSVSGGSGDLYISGFPFTSSSSKGSRSGAWGLNYTWNVNVNPASWWMAQGTSFLYLYFNNNSASSITTSHMGTGSSANRILIQGFYTTDA